MFMHESITYTMYNLKQVGSTFFLNVLQQVRNMAVGVCFVTFRCSLFPLF